MSRFEEISAEIEDLLEKQQSLDSFYNENFQLGTGKEYVENNPNYEQYQNFENYLLLMQRQDWKKNIQVK